MAKRALVGLLVAMGLSACGAGGGASSGEESAGPASSSPEDELAPGERDVAPVARYRFVDTSEGMTVEAMTDTRVTTFSCPTRGCGGMCDECAAQACRAAGELSEACQFLVASCNDSCSCDVAGENCGFPVCALDRMICYVGDETSAPGFGPDEPKDPSPFGPAGRPSESSSNVGRPDF